jgi:gluconate kinase
MPWHGACSTGRFSIGASSPPHLEKSREPSRLRTREARRIRHRHDPVTSRQPSSTRPSPIVCLEGPSAVGKTTLAAALAQRAGAAVIPELDGSAAPPVAESGAWFIEAHAEQWRQARALADTAPLVVMDCDPFKGLWFNWVFADHGWPGIGVQAPLHRAHVEAGTMAFPDLYVVLLATEAQLRARRAGDPTRTRRNHEMHLRLIDPQRRYFQALRAADPARVLLVDTTARDTLVDAVLAAVAALPRDPPDSMRLQDHMADWVATHAPA